MATLFKKQFTKPLPADTKIVTRTVKGESKLFAQSVLDELMRRAELVKAKVLSPDQDRIADHAGTPIAVCNVCWVSCWCIALATPKSITFGTARTSSSSTKIFEGLRSR